MQSQSPLRRIGQPDDIAGIAVMLAAAAGKPVLGICRGWQLINVAFGGTLFQDIAADVLNAMAHINDLYEGHRHGIRFVPDSYLGSVFDG